jgi:hypothetical protein
MGDRTCATCRHWTDITSQYDGMEHPRYAAGEAINPELGNLYTVREPMPDRWGYCGKVDELDPQTKDCQFYVTDGSDYTAHLHTRETFGCNQWEGDGDG